MQIKFLDKYYQLRSPLSPKFKATNTVHHHHNYDPRHHHRSVLLSKKLSNLIIIALTVLGLVYWSYVEVNSNKAQMELKESGVGKGKGVGLGPIDKEMNDRNYDKMIKEPLPKLSLRERLSKNFPYVRDLQIPMRIWQTWKEPIDAISNPSLTDRIKTWSSEANNGYTYKLLDNQSLEELIFYTYEKYPEILQVWKALPMNILRFDFSRYLILYVYGGVYSDIDTVKLTDLSNWIRAKENLIQSKYYSRNSNLGLVIGIEGDLDAKEWHYKISRRVQITQWTLEAKPGHPILLDIITKIVVLTLNEYDSRLNHIRINSQYFTMSSIYTILEWTGPGLFTDVTISYSNSLVESIPDTFIINQNKRHEILNTEFERFHQDPNDIFLNPSLNLGWQNFTKLCEPVQIDDVLILPLKGFNGIRETVEEGEWVCEEVGNDGWVAYVGHGFLGSWKSQT